MSDLTYGVKRCSAALITSHVLQGIEDDWRVWLGGFFVGLSMVAGMQSDEVKCPGEVFKAGDADRFKEAIKNGNDAEDIRIASAARYALYDMYLEWKTDAQMEAMARSESTRVQIAEVIDRIKHKVEVKRGMIEEVPS